MFTRLKDLLPKTIKKQGLGNEFEALQIMNEFTKIVVEMLGKEAVVNVVPCFVKDRVLYIDASSAAWSQQLYMRQHEILEGLQEIVGKKVLIRLKIQVRDRQ